MANVSNKAWDGSASNYSDTASYCKACLINENEGDSDSWTQANCKLPVYEPNGDLNSNAVHAAAAALAGGRGGVKAKPASKKAAAKKLVQLYNQLDDGDGDESPAPDSIKQMAR